MLRGDVGAEEARRTRPQGRVDVLAVPRAEHDDARSGGDEVNESGELVVAAPDRAVEDDDVRFVIIQERKEFVGIARLAEDLTAGEPPDDSGERRTHEPRPAGEQDRAHGHLLMVILLRSETCNFLFNYMLAREVDTNMLDTSSI
ncbi:hypothetical protein GCM10023335_49700 [Streptomyces siamensis]|uniref:Uncharacterized protein n=1 Tax=Streptomyces siamensis TaxID=1274986 RepID=A0ABP9J5N4_9ACTN